MLQAMNTGHDGSLTTIHANTPRDAVGRLEVMVGMANANMGVRSIRQQVASAVDLFVQMSRFSDGTRRVTHITEVVGHGGRHGHAPGHLRVREDRPDARPGKVTGRFRATGIRPKFYERLRVLRHRSCPPRCSRRWWRSPDMPVLVPVSVSSSCSRSCWSSVSVGHEVLRDPRRKKQVTEMLQTVAGPAVGDHHQAAQGSRAGARPSGCQRLLKSWDFADRSGGPAAQRAGWTGPRRELLAAMGDGSGMRDCSSGCCWRPILLNRSVTAPSCWPPLGGMLPYLYRARGRRASAWRSMEEQLPEALDFLARSMRAGHAFTISLEMLGEELPDPLGQEFRTLFNEQNLGAPHRYRAAQLRRARAAARRAVLRLRRCCCSGRPAAT